MIVNILLCDTFPGLFPPSIPSYLSMFDKVFKSVAASTEIRVFNAYQGELPVTLHSDEIYLIGGCRLSAYDDVAWIKQMIGWIRQAYEMKVKLIGICFGHQVIAQALGGTVNRSPKGWGVGIRKSVLTDNEAMAYFPNKEMRLLYNHHDQVTELPQKAIVVATSPFCTYDSFRISNHVLTFQGHPEYVPEYEEYLITNHAADEPESIKSEALHSLTEATHQGRIVASWILNFGK